MRIAKKIYHLLLAIIDSLLLIRNAFQLRSHRHTFRHLIFLSKVGSVGGTELQIELLTKQINHFLVILNGPIEEKSSNRFIKQLKTNHVPFLILGKSGVIKGASSHLAAHFFRWIAPNAKICHFFNPASLHFSCALKKGGFKIYYIETSIPHPSLRIFIANFDYVASVSNVGLVSLRNDFGYKGPGKVIPSMIALSPHKKNDVHIVYVGRLTPLKRVDLLIEAFRVLIERALDVRLTIAGSGELYEQLKTEAALVSDAIHFTGWLNKEETTKLLCDADLLCLPSQLEGLPNVILEAMANALPVVATNVGGVGEIIEHGINGFLVEPSNKNSLIEALDTLVSSRELREKLGINARLFFERRKNPIADWHELLETN